MMATLSAAEIVPIGAARLATDTKARHAGNKLQVESEYFHLINKLMCHDRSKPIGECYDHCRYDDRESHNKMSEDVHY